VSEWVSELLMVLSVCGEDGGCDVIYYVMRGSSGEGASEWLCLFCWYAAASVGCPTRSLGLPIFGLHRLYGVELVNGGRNGMISHHVICFSTSTAYLEGGCGFGCHDVVGVTGGREEHSCRSAL